MEKLLQGLRAAAEPTRLRIIALCGHAELSVTEFVMILGQTQPRVSRHLKLLVEGGLLQRNKEGIIGFPLKRQVLIWRGCEMILCQAKMKCILLTCHD